MSKDRISEISSLIIDEDDEQSVFEYPNQPASLVSKKFKHSTACAEDSESVFEYPSTVPSVVQQKEDTNDSILNCLNKVRQSNYEMYSHAVSSFDGFGPDVTLNSEFSVEVYQPK